MIRKPRNSQKNDTTAGPRGRRSLAHRNRQKGHDVNFWDKDGILLVDYLSQGCSINGQYFANLLDQLKEVIKNKHRGKLTKGKLLLHDNAPSHTSNVMAAKWRTLVFQLVNHLSYSPDLAPSQYQFTNLKKHLKGHHFEGIEDVKEAIKRWFRDQLKDFYLRALEKLQQQCNKCSHWRICWTNAIFYNSSYLLSSQRQEFQHPYKYYSFKFKKYKINPVMCQKMMINSQ